MNTGGAPLLTASGDLSHHLASTSRLYTPGRTPGREDRLRIDSGSVWEEIGGYSRAVRIGNRIVVSGTTATHTDGGSICPEDAAGQATYILDKISASIASVGGSLEDVVRTRVYITDESGLGSRRQGARPILRRHSARKFPGRRFRPGGRLSGGDRSGGPAALSGWPATGRTARPTPSIRGACSAASRRRRHCWAG